MPVQWSGSWEGGRTAISKGKTVYYIEKAIGPRGAAERFTLCLGPVSPDDAKVELALFDRDPRAYKTPERAREAAHQERERERQEHDASAVILNAKLIEDFCGAEGALTKGYGNVKAPSPHHLFVTHAYLSKWATQEETKKTDTTEAKDRSPLNGHDIRTVQTADLQKFLGNLPAGAKHWIVSLKSLTSWLRWKGELKLADDPTLALTVPQAKKLSPTEMEEKVYAIDHLEATYSVIPNQDVRDVFRIRCLTGLHVSEIRRIAKKQAVIKPVSGSKIAATVDVVHKAGLPHRQSVDADTLVAINRLLKRGTFPTEKTFKRSMKTAAKVSKTPEVVIANLRATFATLATEKGSIVQPPKTKAGVPLHLVSQIIGHHDTRTTKDFYLGQQIPQMVTLPITFHHQSDPQPVAKPSAQRGQLGGKRPPPKRVRG